MRKCRRSRSRNQGKIGLINFQQRNRDFFQQKSVQRKTIRFVFKMKLYWKNTEILLEEITYIDELYNRNTYN